MGNKTNPNLDVIVKAIFERDEFLRLVHNTAMECEIQRIDKMYGTLFEKLMKIDVSLANELQDLWSDLNAFRDSYNDFNYGKFFGCAPLD